MSKRTTQRISDAVTKEINSGAWDKRVETSRRPAYMKSAFRAQQAAQDYMFDLLRGRVAKRYRGEYITKVRELIAASKQFRIEANG